MNEQIIARILGNTHKPNSMGILTQEGDERVAVCECCDKIISCWYREPEEDRLGGWTAWRVKQ